MFYIISLLLFFVLIFLNFSSNKIIQVQILSRHCDRTPFYPHNIPKEPKHICKELNVDWGQLTGEGMNQCKLLGDSIRKRYILNGTISNIYKSFQSLDYKFIASGYHRTILSSWSISMGLFKNVGPKDDISEKDSLPGGVTPIPIHSVLRKNDALFSGYSTEHCPNAEYWLKSQYLTPFYKQQQLKYSQTFEKIKQLTGFKKVDLSNFDKIFDVIFAQFNHKLFSQNSEMKNYFTENKIQELYKIASISSRLLLKRETIGNKGGGLLVQRFIKEMNDRIYKKPDQNKKIPEGFKFIHYSGHDSTIQAVFASLRLEQDYTQLQTIPKYGSALIFELHEKDNNNNNNNVIDENNYFVKILFKNGYDGEYIEYPLKSLSGIGCEKECQFKKFKEICQNDAIPKNWCSECNNQNVDFCMKQILSYKSIVSTIFVICIPFLISLCIILLLIIICFSIRKFRKKSLKNTFLNINN